MLELCCELAGVCGIDPDPRTLRELLKIADGRQKAAWSHTVALALTFGKVMTGQGPSLIDLIPERYRGTEKELSPEDEAAQSALAFAELEAGLRAISRQAAPRLAGFKEG